MATIIEKKNKDGEVISYKMMTCVGRDEQYKQVWRTKTIRRPEGMTPAKERKEVQRQADEWELEQKAEYSRTHAKADKTKITLADFINSHWLPDHVKDGEHTPTSVAFYESISSNVLEYFGPHKRLSAITTEDVKRYVKWLRTEARTKPKLKKDGKPGKPGHPYSPTTVVHHFNVLRNVLEYAERLDYIDKDPTRKLSPKEKPHKDNKPVDFLVSDDAKRFLRCLDEEPLYWRTLVNVLVTTGLRRGECVGLQWGDFDADDLTLTIRRNVTIDKNAADKVHIGSTKGKESRVVPVSPRVAALLLEHRKEQGIVLDTAYIFNTPTDPYKPLYPCEPTSWTARFVKRHKLPNVSPHDLRHTCATLALESGANLKQVQSLLGHRDPKTTLSFYAGVSEQTQRATVAGIESLLG